MPESAVGAAVPVRLAAQIGRIVTLWALLEWRLSRILYRLLGLDEAAGQLAVRTPRAAARLGMIRALLAERGIALALDLAALERDVDQLAAFRDALAHGVWVRDRRHRRLFLQADVGPGAEARHAARTAPRRARMPPRTGLKVTPADCRRVALTLRRLHARLDRLEAGLAATVAPPAISRG